MIDLDLWENRDPTICASSGNLLALVQDETVILKLRTGQYYGLNVVGSRLWQLIQSPMKLSAIIEQLLREYEVNPAKLRNDIIDLVDKLITEDLAVIDQGSAHRVEQTS